MRRLPALLFALLALLSSISAAQEGRPPRVALVIGNAAYRKAPLANPVNDAADMAKALEASGFTVIRRENATLREMHLALREFGDKLGRNANGLFYFAGHGLQVRGRNFLLPVDADIAREDEVAFAALDLAAVLEKMDSARNPLNLVILDACRNNPFAKRFQLAAPGLAQIDAPAGTLIAFATAPGSVAADGAGRNGVYTQHLLNEMARPGIPIEEVFKGVRAAVRKQTNGLQVPWESTSLEGNFAFHAAPAARAPAAIAAAPASRTPARSVPASVGAPPAFAPGDRWRYRVRNLLTGDDRAVGRRVREVRGDEVHYDPDMTSDTVGNPIHEGTSVYAPSAQLLAFPMTPGSTWNFTLVQVRDGRTYDTRTTVKVVGEEVVETPAGRLPAMRLEREAHWQERGRDNTGTASMVYWYSAAVKRIVASESKNMTSKGKLVAHDRLELEAWNVR